MSNPPYYIWINGDNGAVLQMENSPYNYEALHDSKKKAKKWLKRYMNQPAVNVDEDWSHVELREVGGIDTELNGEDVRQEILVS